MMIFGNLKKFWSHGCYCICQLPPSFAWVYFSIIQCLVWNANGFFSSIHSSNLSSNTVRIAIWERVFSRWFESNPIQYRIGYIIMHLFGCIGFARSEKWTNWRRTEYTMKKLFKYVYMRVTRRVLFSGRAMKYTIRSDSEYIPIFMTVALFFSSSFQFVNDSIVCIQYPEDRECNRAQKLVF